MQPPGQGVPAYDCGQPAICNGSFGVSRLSDDGNFILVENAVHGNTEQTSGRDDRILRSLPGNKTAVIFSSGHKKTVSQVLS